MNENFYKNDNGTLNIDLVCEHWVGTVGASSFGSWNSFNTKEEAVTLLNELVEVFSTMIECPSQEVLNLKFRELGVSFWIE